MNTNKISETLGIAPPETTKKEIVETNLKVADTAPGTGDSDVDYALARQTFTKLIETGNMAIKDLHDLAVVDETPRSFEVLATLIKTVSDTTKDLYDIHKKTKQLKEPIQTGRKRINMESGVNIDKAVFVGSPADMLDRIRNKE